MHKPKLLFILAHPDDESFISSGTIAKYAHEGAQVIHICATKGESGRFANLRQASHPEQLKIVRCAELKSACQILGINEYYILDYPDGHLSEIDPVEPIKTLVNFIRQEKPDVVVTFDVTGISRHTDHVTIHKWATQAFYLANNPFYETSLKEVHTPAKLYYLTVPSDHMISISDSRMMKKYIDRKITTVIYVRKYIEEKKKAIECHKSQCYNIQRIFKFAGGMDELDDHEYYILAHCNIPDYAYEVFENDLLSGIPNILKSQRVQYTEEVPLKHT